jgi:hypothetical protein
MLYITHKFEYARLWTQQCTLHSNCNESVFTIVQRTQSVKRLADSPMPMSNETKICGFTKFILERIQIAPRKPSPQRAAYAGIQMVTSILFSYWEHTQLQISTFLEHINFGAGFKENVTATRSVSRFKF